MNGIVGFKIPENIPSKCPYCGASLQVWLNTYFSDMSNPDSLVMEISSVDCPKCLRKIDLKLPIKMIKVDKTK